MGHWAGYAPGYSREVEQASEAVRFAERTLQATLDREYPKGSYVRVVHSRGEFCGYVVGCSYYGSRVYVENENSFKTGKWWAAHVELIEKSKPSPEVI